MNAGRFDFVRFMLTVPSDFKIKRQSSVFQRIFRAKESYKLLATGSCLSNVEILFSTSGFQCRLFFFARVLLTFSSDFDIKSQFTLSQGSMRAKESYK